MPGNQCVKQGCHITFQGPMQLNYNVFSSGSIGRVEGGAKKHEIYVAVFGFMQRDPQPAQWLERIPLSSNDIFPL